MGKGVTAGTSRVSLSARETIACSAKRTAITSEGARIRRTSEVGCTGGCTTVAGERSAIWSTTANRRCCYGPSGRSCTDMCTKQHMENPFPVQGWSQRNVGIKPLSITLIANNTAKSGPCRAGPNRTRALDRLHSEDYSNSQSYDCGNEGAPDVEDRCVGQVGEFDACMLVEHRIPS